MKREYSQAEIDEARHLNRIDAALAMDRPTGSAGPAAVLNKNRINPNDARAIVEKAKRMGWIKGASSPSPKKPLSPNARALLYAMAEQLLKSSEVRQQEAGEWLKENLG